MLHANVHLWHEVRCDLPTWPTLKMEISVTAGCQEYGRCTEPVSSKIGFGAWHATCGTTHATMQIMTKLLLCKPATELH